jgi:hypothetical protein
MMKMQGIRALLDNVVTSRNLVEMTQSRNLLTSCIEHYANQRVIEELEMILDRTKLAVNLDSLREHIESQIKLKQD